MILTPQTTLVELRAALDAGEPLIVTTSGSTSEAKRVRLSSEALSASVRATAELIGEGNWYLCLPLHYVAGVQVVNRARLSEAGRPGRGVLLTQQQAPSFAHAAQVLPQPRYTSVVPAQLHAIFAALQADDPAERARGAAELAALAEFRRVLVGGQALPKQLRERLRAAGVPIIESYGMTETSGGCIYDGTPLSGVRVQIGPEGRIQIAGPMLADGYLDEAGQLSARTAEHFVADAAGERWYLSDDRGEYTEGLLRVLGRVDDVLISGGLKLDVAEVQRWLDAVHPELAAVAFAAPSARWGQSLGVFVPSDRRSAGLAGNGTESLTASLTESLSEELQSVFGVAARPRIVSASIVPVLPNGKPDRRHLATMVGDEYEAEAQS